MKLGMKLEKINKVVWYKKSRPGQEPVRYVAQKIGQKNVYVTLYADPVLKKKKNKDLKKALFTHEIREAMLWSRGSTHAHTEARKAEPNETEHIGGVSGFWKEVKRRDGNITPKPKHKHKRDIFKW